MQTLSDDTLSMLRDAAKDFCTQGATRFPRTVDGQRRWWREIALMGWLGVAVPEEYGGSDSGLPAAGIIALELGRTARIAGFAESAAFAAVLAARGGEVGPQAANVVRAITNADLQLAVPQVLEAWEHGRSGLLADVGAERLGVVQWQPGRGLLLREINAAERRRTVSTTARASQVLLDDVTDGGAVLLASETTGQALWDDAQATCRCLMAAQAIGAAQAALAIADEYARVRVQFGRPIGSYQAVQHALVDMLATSDAAELLVLRALSGLEHQADDRFSLTAAAVAFARDTAWTGLMKCYDVLGGIGFIEEHPINITTRALLPLLTALGSGSECDEAAAIHVRAGHWLAQPSRSMQA